MHERAGVTDVVHLHGSMFAPRCAACGQPHLFTSNPPEEPSLEITPPQCMHCGDWVRPGVVWFGENLDAALMFKARKQIEECDLLLVVGTTGVVIPAATLVALAPETATVVEINPAKADHSTRGHHHWQTTSGHGLPLLVKFLQANAHASKDKDLQ
jgi:NAD-dependent deacetylase